MRLPGGLAASLLLLGCASAPRLLVLPSLAPVDASRPYVLYGPVQGNACGEGAEARAVDDLYRLGSADGFVAVVVTQEKKRGGCVTVTARPFTYGCSPRALGPDATGAPQLVAPGPTSCPNLDTCTPDCNAYAAKLGAGELETAAFQSRCFLRCKANDAAFMTCARAAASAADVRRCDAQ